MNELLIEKLDDVIDRLDVLIDIQIEQGVSSD